MTISMEWLQNLLLQQYVAAQHELDLKDTIPGTKRRAFRIRLFSLLGAIQLALLVACFAIFVNFIVINLIFHITP